MATSLAAQLSQIAANSTKSLDLKAQKASHSKSLIFEPKVAASQSFDSLYTLCHEGFQELCLLDKRFLEYQRTLFSEGSQNQDRTQMTKAENEELDRKIEAFLGLVGARLRLNPAIKAVEWLVRRFKIHEYNTAFTLTTFLPYHTLPVFATLSSILPAQLPSQYRFLHPYVRSLSCPPRHAIVFTATNDTTFAALFNGYVLQICRERQNYPALLTFWAGVMTEAISSQLDKARSGRQAVQAQQVEEVTLRILPTLSEGLAMKRIPELRIGCYMLLSIMASKGGLDDNVLTAMMEAVVLGWTSDTFVPGLVCLAILAQQRGAKQVTKTLTRELLKVSGLPELLVEISKQRRIDKLANGIVLALVARLDKRGDASVLPLIEHIVEHQLLTEAQATVTVKALLLAAYRLNDEIDVAGIARSDLAKTLTHLAENGGKAGESARKAMEDASVDIDELELKLQASVRPKMIKATADGDVDMEDADEETSAAPVDFSVLLAKVGCPEGVETSFLSHGEAVGFETLAEAFMVAVADEEKLKQFDAAMRTRRDDTLEYATFYARIWCGPYPVLARSAALQQIKQRITEIEGHNVDMQALVPYLIVALEDPAAKVRRAAAEAIVATNNTYPADSDLKKAKKVKQWAHNVIYGENKLSKEVSWLSLESAAKFVREVISPSLEECILDKNHVVVVIEKALNGNKNETKSPKKGPIQFTQAFRNAVLAYLASHTINTSSYVAKYRLLSTLNEVHGVGSTSRTKVLLPLLQGWATLSQESAQQFCQAEQIDIADYDKQAVAIVVPNDKHGFEALAAIAKGEVAHERQSLCAATFSRFKDMWSMLDAEPRLNLAQLLMDISQWPAGQPGPTEFAVAEVSGLLRDLDLTTDILLSFLNQLPTAANLVDAPPSSKRRRVSHGEIAKTPLSDSKQLTGAIQKVTFVLQLVDSSSPEEHPALLPGLFTVLAELQHFKSQVGSELGFLQGLCLSSLLAIMKAHKANPKLKLDRSAVRADLLVDCVQKTASPQVQNAALLLIASLADTAPELVLHSVMPIFTFMGSSVLRQNDEYSAHVIKQTIAQVIPPLIASLRKQKGGPVLGSAELLLSFIAAYEHVPAHRRKGLYTSLVQTLGAEDFLFAVLAMLADKYNVTENIKAFTVDLASSFPVDVQLQSAIKYLDLTADVLKPKPTVSAALLSAADSANPDVNRTALIQLTLLPHLLSEKRLIDQTGRMLQRNDEESAHVRDLYATLLEDILKLADTVKSDKKLHNACGNVLEAVLGLLSTAEFVKSVESLLDRTNTELRHKILRSLEVRVDQERIGNVAARNAILAFLPQLTAIIRESKDVLYKHIAVSCVDKICEKYGKKDLEAVAVAAETIAGEQCLGQSDERLQVMSLLCLASLVDILREGIVPVLPVAIPQALGYLEEAVAGEQEKLHNAAYSFIAALVEHMPYMITGGYLDRLLQISNKSAEAEFDVEADEARLACLDLAAKQIEAKSMFTALQKNWAVAAQTGVLVRLHIPHFQLIRDHSTNYHQALREYLDILSTSITKHPKSVVAKSSSILSTIFLSAFDLRRQWEANASLDIDADEINEIEGVVNAVAIKMIYKFNDAVFRPIFAKLVEWASTGSGLPKKDTSGKNQRLLSVYSFLNVFFGDLKSIVTSYSTYILDCSISVLSSVDPSNEESRELWARVLDTLSKSFEHDQDDFWTAPSHFDLVLPALISQFSHAAAVPLTTHLLPAIVALAYCADSAEHHKALNTALLKLLRSESAAVRLAAVKAQQALTERLGEEWLSLLPEMLPFISECQEDEDEGVERETQRWIVGVEGVLGESLDSMLQ
jgi:U3 small nucleolar RNA-associated protein 10